MPGDFAPFARAGAGLHVESAAPGAGRGDGTAVWGEGAPWDARKARACVCDAGWTEIDCSRRLCPVGYDKMDDTAMGGAVEPHRQLIVLALRDRASRQRAQRGGASFALRFTSTLHEQFATRRDTAHAE